MGETETGSPEDQRVGELLSRPAIVAVLAVSAGRGKSWKQRLVLQRLVRDVVAASVTEADALETLERIRQETRLDLPPLDEHIDGMIGQGTKPRLAVVR
jgi:hypothetical protein